MPMPPPALYPKKGRGENGRAWVGGKCLVPGCEAALRLPKSPRHKNRAVASSERR